MRPVEFLHIGPQKSGTTWIYRCLKEHPAIVTSSHDWIHYFDMFYAHGEAWYASHFREPRPGQVRFDPTPSYLRSPWAPRRIAAHNPAARIALCLRDPVERAFSHYWHEKKKRRIDYDFGEVLRNYDLFASWLETGFYAEHLERYFERFPREQILVQRFETMQSDPGGFLRSLLEFIGVDAAFTPTVRDRRVNVAGARHDLLNRGLHGAQKAMRLAGLEAVADRLQQSPRLSGRGEYLRGVPDELGARLRELCRPEIDRLQTLLGIDLSAWREPGAAPVTPPGAAPLSESA